MQKEVTQDLYTWLAVYRDNTYLYEVKEDQSRRGWSEVNAERVSAIVLTADGQPVHQVRLPIGAKPIFFRRRSLTVNPNTSEQQGPVTTVHCIGWQASERAAYLFIFEDGRVLLTDDFQAV